MILGIDCSRYLTDEPTGVEVYTDRLLDRLIPQADALGYEEVRLYVKNAKQLEKCLYLVDNYQLKTVQVRLINHSRLWTMLWLSWEMVWRPVGKLFVPSHAFPLFFPKGSVLTVHGIEAIRFPKAYSWFQRWYQTWMLKRSVRKGAEYIAVSHLVEDEVVEYLGVGDERVKVVWNGVDRIQNSKSKIQNSKIDGDYILNVGRMEERKNQLRLVEAFEVIAEEFPKLKLVLVGGKGFGFEKIEKAVSSSQFAERIVMMGHQERGVVESLMKKAIVFAYPSLAEGFGIPILEAFLAECAVLTSVGSACEEIGGGAAVYCDPESVQSIAEGLKKLLIDEQLRDQKVRDGKKRVDLFSWDRCAEETIRVLQLS